MWFKNLTLFRITPPFEFDPASLLARMEAHVFQPCAAGDAFREGWTAPLGSIDAPLLHASQGFLMMTLRREEKVIPGGALRERVAKRVAELEAVELRPLNRKAREALREEVLNEMLTLAFTQSRRTSAFIDPRSGLLFVDTASSRRAEDLIAHLRKTLDGFPVRPLVLNERPAHVMTRWLLEGNLPLDLSFDTACELKSPDLEGATVKVARQDLSAPEMTHHLEAGKEVSRLALVFEERLGFVLDEALVLRRLRFLETPEMKIGSHSEDPAAQFDAEFVLMALELTRLVPHLTTWFGGEPAPDAT